MINRVGLHPFRPGESLSLKGNYKRGLKGWFFGIATLLGLLVVGCTQGSYPVDIFYEQHYQQSFKSHEPPRLTERLQTIANV